MTYEKAVSELYFWKHSDGTNFTAQLYDLIAKADNENIERIRMAFPLEVKAHEDWFNSKDEDEFFEKNCAILK